MRTEEKLLGRDLAVFAKKMKKAGIDVVTIKKPIDMGVSIGQLKTISINQL